MPFLKIHSTLPCKCFVFFDYVGEQWGVSFCFQTIKHELGFRKRVVSTVEHRRGGKYPFRGHPNRTATGPKNELESQLMELGQLTEVTVL